MEQVVSPAFRRSILVSIVVSMQQYEPRPSWTFLTRLFFQLHFYSLTRYDQSNHDIVDPGRKLQHFYFFQIGCLPDPTTPNDSNFAQYREAIKGMKDCRCISLGLNPLEMYPARCS